MMCEYQTRSRLSINSLTPQPNVAGAAAGRRVKSRPAAIGKPGFGPGVRVFETNLPPIGKMAGRPGDVTDRDARGDIVHAQQQREGGGEAFAMPLALVENKIFERIDALEGGRAEAIGEIVAQIRFESPGRFELIRRAGGDLMHPFD